MDITQDTINGIECILKHSGIAAFLPTEIKDSICHSVARDIVCEYLAAEGYSKWEHTVVSQKLKSYKFIPLKGGSK